MESLLKCLITRFAFFVNIHALERLSPQTDLNFCLLALSLNLFNILIGVSVSSVSSVSSSSSSSSRIGFIFRFFFFLSLHTLTFMYNIYKNGIYLIVENPFCIRSHCFSFIATFPFQSSRWERELSRNQPILAEFDPLKKYVRRGRFPLLFVLCVRTYDLLIEENTRRKLLAIHFDRFIFPDPFICHINFLTQHVCDLTCMCAYTCTHLRAVNAYTNKRTYVYEFCLTIAIYFNRNLSST